MKCGVRLAVIALIVQTGQLISTGSRNRTAEILWYVNSCYFTGRDLRPLHGISVYGTGLENDPGYTVLSRILLEYEITH